MVALVVLLLCVASANAVSFVRVNQAGFLAAERKVAYYQSTAAATNLRGQVVSSSGAVVFEDAFGTSRGQWNTKYPFVYQFNFTAFTGTGVFRVQANDASKTQSPRFRIETSAAALYGPLAAASSFFFQAQRDGRNINASTLARKASHLTDESAIVYSTPTYNSKEQLVGDLTPVSGAARVNVEGGWHDAGDYIKFVETASYVTSLLLLSVRDAPTMQRYGDFRGEAVHGLKWLLKMWDDNTKTLYYQVGIGNGNNRIDADHDLWRLPEADDKMNVQPGHRQYYIKFRPVFRDSAPGTQISPNLAGRLAASFGLCAQLFGVEQPALAAQCLKAGENVYALAKSFTTCEVREKQLLTTAPFAFYPETEWCSDMEFGAMELHLAGAKGKDYLGDAAKWATMYLDTFDTAQPLNLYDVAAVAHLEVARSLSSAGGLRGQIVENLRGALSNALKVAATDPFGLAFDYQDGIDAGPMILGQSVTASIFAELTRENTYRAFEQDQRSFAFGANGWGSSFMVGAADVETGIQPHCMQHQVANLIGSLDGKAPLLLGAVVDGPNEAAAVADLDDLPDGGRKCPPSGVDAFNEFTRKNWRYLDDARCWATAEPADDYAIMAVLLESRMLR